MTGRSFLTACLAIAWLIAPLSSRAQDGARRTEIEAGASYENLDGGYSDWRSAYLAGERRFRPGQTLYGQWRWTERFDLDDDELLAGYAHPLAPTWGALIEASASPTHEVLPRWSALVALSKSLPRGFRVEAGYRRTEYNDASTNLGIGTLERYFASFRAAYSVYYGAPEGTDPVTTHRVALDWYYGERNTLGVSLAVGREAENVGPPTGVIITDVANATLLGRHWLNRQWAVSYELAWQDQGDLYTRTALRLGLRRAF